MKLCLVVQISAKAHCFNQRMANIAGGDGISAGDTERFHEIRESLRSLRRSCIPAFNGQIASNSRINRNCTYALSK